MLLTGAFAPAAAGDWTIAPRFTLGATYSDNIQLSDTDRQGEMILTQQPGVSVRGNSGRASVNFDYNLQNRVYVEEGSRNALDNQLGATAQAEIIRDMLFLDARANVGRQNVNTFGRVSDTPLLDTGNTAQVVNWSFGPSFRYRLPSLGSVTANYTFSNTSAGGQADEFGGAQHNVNFNLNSGEQLGRFGWAISTGASQSSSFQGGSDPRFGRVNGQLSYQFHRRFRAFTNLGYDLNDFQSVTGEDDSGVTWSLGATWTPTPRSTLTASYGDRPFGGTFSMDARHRAGRWNFTSRYTEDFTTTQQVLLQRSQFILVDEEGLPIIDPDTNSFVIIDADIPRLTDDVILQRRFDYNLSYQLRRGTLGLNAYRDDRSFQEAGDSEQVYGIRLNASRPLSPRLRSSLSLFWESGDSDAPLGGAGLANEFERYGLTPRLNYTFGRSLTGSLLYSHQRSDGNGTGADYYENRVSGFLTLTF